jgi:thiosulfate reductase cytochrome b subunit
MSPGFNAIAPWMLDLFGGRQSARTLHFISASGLVGFVVVHVLMVLVSGLFNNMRSMITGYYTIEGEEP